MENFEYLIEQFRKKLSFITTQSIREIDNTIHWESRLIGIRGARGVGKTTLLLQHIKKYFFQNLSEVLYLSLDNLWFAQNSLVEAVDYFAKTGGKYLFLDEVHKYPQWSVILKNIYDDYPELHIVFTGSSLLEILQAKVDLSRRAVVYTMQGLSFREYLNLQTNTQFPQYSFEQIIHNHEQLSMDIVSKVRPLKYFDEYLRTGYYPFYLEGIEVYYGKLEETISLILDMELPLLRNIEIAYVPKLKQLLAIIAESAPFIPNILKLSERIGISRTTLLTYLQYLEEAKLIRRLYRQSTGISALQKPDKLFLENPNLMYLLGMENTNIGNVRETFLANQLGYGHHISFPETGDLRVDDKITIEVGGKNKTRKQIRDVPDSYVAADTLEYGVGTKIPLWLFGFLY